MAMTPVVNRHAERITRDARRGNRPDQRTPRTEAGARVLLLAICLLMLVNGCSSAGGEQPEAIESAPSDPAAVNLVRTSTDVTKKLSSAHIRIELRGDFSRMGQASVIDGDAQARPLVVNGQVTYTTGAVAPLVIADDKVLVKIGGAWNEAGATSTIIPAPIIDPANGLPNLMGSIESPQGTGDEVIDGVNTTRITGTMPADTVKDLLPEATGPAETTLWVRATGEPYLVRGNVDFSAEQGLTVTVSNWDVPVRVTAKPAP